MPDTTPDERAALAEECKQPAEIRTMLEKALELSKYAAAPFFFGDKESRSVDGEVFEVYRTTEEWWDGLEELIEEVQPMLVAAIASTPPQSIMQPDQCRDALAELVASRAELAKAHDSTPGECPFSDLVKLKDRINAAWAVARAALASTPPQAAPVIIKGALLQRLFHDMPQDDLVTKEESDSWWKLYAAKVRLAIAGEPAAVVPSNELIAAAQAVVAQWDGPNFKALHTGVCIDRLRAALDKESGNV